MGQPLDHHHHLVQQQQQPALLHAHALIQQQQQQHHDAAVSPLDGSAHAPQASTSTSTAPSPDLKPALDDDGNALSQSQLKKQPAKLFRCTGFGDCQMTFTRSEHLARHVRKHTGERPFKCHCGREFSRLDNVRQHAATVHAEQAERNAQTIADLVALHNQLSVSTQLRQKEAGMILQDSPGPEKGSRRRGDGEAKPKKPSAKKKQTAAERKAREQAEAAEQAIERQRAVDQEAAVAAAQQRSPQGQASLGAPHQQSALPHQLQASPYASLYGSVARPPQAAAGLGGSYPPYGAPSPYAAAAPPALGAYQQNAYAHYSSQLAGHPVYGTAIAPPPPHNVSYLPPGMDMYAAAASYAPPTSTSSQSTHAYGPPPPPSPHAQSAVTATDPHHPHEQLQQSSSGRYGPAGHVAYPPASTPHQSDAGQLTPNKISLPSISALLPSPFANGQQSVQQQPQPQPQQQHRDAGAQIGPPGGLDGQQQSYYPAMGATSQGRAPAHVGAAQQHTSPHLQQHGIQQPYGAYPTAGVSELGYSPQQQQQGVASQQGYDPYARPSSTNGSERECPPSLSNGSSSTTSSFQAGSPQHPHLTALHHPAAQPHYSHLYNPSAAAQSAYQYAPPPQAQQVTAYPYSSAQYLAAGQQSFALGAAAAQGFYAPKYPTQQPHLHSQHGAYARMGAREGAEQRGA